MIIGTFDNSAGTIYRQGSTNEALSPFLDENVSGSATSVDPTVITYAYEFDDTQVTTYSLPDITTEQQISCYMTAVNMHTSSIQQGSDDLQSKSEVELISQTNTVAGGSSPADQNTSGAADLIGNKTVITLIAMIGFMAMY